MSTQEMVAFVPSQDKREAVATMVAKRFGSTGMGRTAIVADASELRDHFAQQRERGVERFYVWFLDFAPAATLEAFGGGVISAFG